MNMKDRIRRSERGEWEPIKILRENLVYVTNLTQRASLLARPRPHSYRKVICSQNQIRKTNTERKHKSARANLRHASPPTSPDDRLAAA
jgi:hypothetical protein